MCNHHEKGGRIEPNDPRNTPLLGMSPPLLCFLETVGEESALKMAKQPLGRKWNSVHLNL